MRIIFIMKSASVSNLFCKMTTITIVSSILHLVKLVEGHPTPRPGKLPFEADPQILDRNSSNFELLGAKAGLDLLQLGENTKRYSTNSARSNSTFDSKEFLERITNRPFIKFHNDNEHVLGSEISNDRIRGLALTQSVEIHPSTTLMIGKVIRKNHISNVDWKMTEMGSNTAKKSPVPRENSELYFTLGQGKYDLGDGYLLFKQVDESEEIEGEKDSDTMIMRRKKIVSFLKMPYTSALQTAQSFGKSSRIKTSLAHEKDPSGFDSDDQGVWSQNMRRHSRKNGGNYFPPEEFKIHSDRNRKDDSDRFSIENSPNELNISPDNLSFVKGSLNKWLSLDGKILPPKESRGMNKFAYLRNTVSPVSSKLLEIHDLGLHKTKNRKLMGSNSHNLQKSDGTIHPEMNSRDELRQKESKNIIRVSQWDDTFVKNRLDEIMDSHPSTRDHKIVKKDLANQFRLDSDESIESGEDDSSKEKWMNHPATKKYDPGDSDEESSDSEENSHSSEEGDSKVNDNRWKPRPDAEETNHEGSNSVYPIRHLVLSGNNTDLRSKSSLDVKRLYTDCDGTAWKPLLSGDVLKITGLE